MTRRAAVLILSLALGAGCGSPGGGGGSEKVSPDSLRVALPPSPLGEGPQTGLPTVELAFPDGETIRVDVADDSAEREKGLMFRTELAPDYGMLFVFDREGPLEFWMKNTLVDLDMVFIDAQKRITVVHEWVPRSRLDTPESQLARRAGLARYVLELPAGAAARRGLKPGQTLRFPG
jgi:uncharacterized membrane protein (UPF0127 family)